MVLGVKTEKLSILETYIFKTFFYITRNVITELIQVKMLILMIFIF